MFFFFHFFLGGGPNPWHMNHGRLSSGHESRWSLLLARGYMDLSLASKHAIRVTASLDFSLIWTVITEVSQMFISHQQMIVTREGKMRAKLVSLPTRS